MICKNCGKEVADHRAICPYCGRTLGLSTPPAPPTIRENYPSSFLDTTTQLKWYKFYKLLPVINLVICLISFFILSIIMAVMHANFFMFILFLLLGLGASAIDYLFFKIILAPTIIQTECLIKLSNYKE